MRIIIICFLAVLAATQTCAVGQWFNGQRCAPCQANCKCTSDFGCDSCASGYTFDPTFTQCRQCPNTLSGNLQPCLDCCSQVAGTQFLCSSCTNTTGFTFIRGGQCINVPGCIGLGFDGVCQSCTSGYYLNNGLCQACHLSCATCIDDNYCDTCAIGYYNTTTGNRPYCLACPATCSSCTSATTCTGCITGYKLSGSSCAACPSNCAQCATSCTVCNTGYTLISSVCESCLDLTKGGSIGCTECTTSATNRVTCTKCNPAGYYLNGNGACVACTTTWPNSQTCTSSGPIQCQNDYSSTLSSRYHLVNGNCLANTRNCKMMLPDGKCSSCYFQNGLYYTLSGSGSCVQCIISGCDLTKLVQSSGCVCQACLPGYRFVNNICIACSNLRCTACPISPNNCTACEDHYGIFSSACASCNQARCLNCDGDIDKCNKCQDGYYLKGGTCYSCQASCSQCKSNTECYTCNSGYYLHSSGLCKILPQNCVEVYTNGMCKLCSFGYYPIEGSCYTCAVGTYNMDLCPGFCPNYYSLLATGRIVILVALLAFGMF